MQVHVHGGLRIVVDGFAVYQVGNPVPGNLRRCYELSATRAALGPSGRNWSSGYEGATLVNGTIQGVDSDPIGHAWVIEPDGTVWEPASATTYPADVFEALFAAVPIVTYSSEEARMNMATTHHTGPWAEEASIAS